MTDSIKKAFVELMIDKQFISSEPSDSGTANNSNDGHNSKSSTSSTSTSTSAAGAVASHVSINKENLIVIDTDIWDDYPLANEVAFRIPHGYKVVYLSKIPHQQIPLLLQRAKVNIVSVFMNIVIYLVLIL